MWNSSDNTTETDLGIVGFMRFTTMTAADDGFGLCAIYKKNKKKRKKRKRKLKHTWSTVTTITFRPEQEHSQQDNYRSCHGRGDMTEHQPSFQVLASDIN